MKDEPVDLSLVPEGWNSKKGKWASEEEIIAQRAKGARQWLKNRPEKEIVVVTHGGFLHYLTEDWTGRSKLWGRYLLAELMMKYSDLACKELAGPTPSSAHMNLTKRAETMPLSSKLTHRDKEEGGPRSL